APKLSRTGVHRANERPHQPRRLEARCAIGREGDRSDPTRVRYLWNDIAPIVPQLNYTPRTQSVSLNRHERTSKNRTKCRVSTDYSGSEEESTLTDGLVGKNDNEDRGSRRGGASACGEPSRSSDRCPIEE